MVNTEVFRDPIPSEYAPGVSGISTDDFIFSDESDTRSAASEVSDTV